LPLGVADHQLHRGGAHIDTDFEDVDFHA